jgi:DNA replication and repair protein RecF
VSSLDPVLADLGERIHTAREQQCNALFETVQQTLEALNPSQGSVELRYQRGWSELPLRQALGVALERDMERGATGPGPHRAEIFINCATGPAREILSRGEQKILATALLLSQASIMAAAGDTPLLLMDDLASEFDARRLARVMEFGSALGAQAWVTGTSLEPYPERPATGFSVFHVEHGNLSIKTSR